MLSCDYHIDVIPAAQAVIEDRQQTIGIGRKINANDIGLLIDDVVEEAGILVCESVVILLPDVRGEQIVQRRNLPAPGKFQADFQPLGVLAEHRIDDTDERLVAVEQSVPPGQKVPFQPTLALILAEHRVQHATGGREELVIFYFTGVPLTVGEFKNRAEKIRESLIGPEDTEITLILVQFGNVAQEATQHQCILSVNLAGRRNVHGVKMKIRHAQVAQQNAAVGVRIGAHPAVALRCQFSQFRHEPPILIEQLLGFIALHPTFKLLDMIGMLRIYEKRHLVRTESALDLQTIDEFGPRPALW